ncbi:MAG: hypothetical protein ACXWXQ_08230 [Actinomycetota bacterium]
MTGRAWRRVERFSLGVVFGFMAWFIERRVLKAIRRRGGAEPRAATLSDTVTKLEHPAG